MKTKSPAKKGHFVSNGCPAQRPTRAMATSPPPATRSPAPPERAGRTPGSIVRRSRAAHDRDPAEVVVVGEITGATGFEKSTRGGSVWCKWAVVHGERWTLTRGDKSGATQAAKACWAGGELATWAHPIQLSFKTTSAQARPRVASRRVASVARRPVDLRTRANRANGLLLFRCQRRSSSLPPSLPPSSALADILVRRPRLPTTTRAGLAEARVRGVRARRVERRGRLRGVRHQGAFCTLVPIRPRRRGERRSLRTFPGASLRPHLDGFNPDTPRCLSTPPLTPMNSTPISSLV